MSVCTSSRPIRLLFLLLLGLVAATLVPQAVAAKNHRHGSHEHMTQLGVIGSGEISQPIVPGHAIHWSTPKTTCDGERCEGWSYQLTVTGVAPGQSLQVAIDEAYIWDDTLLEVTGPDGREVSDDTSGHYYSTAVTIDPAVRGTYIVRVAPQSMRESQMRLRAGLMDPPPAAGPPRDLLPNLRVLPPFDFTFAMPAQAMPGLGIGVSDTSSPMPGSCQPDEQQMHLDPTQTDDPRLITRCLRFTAGPENTGEGHLDLRFPWIADPQSEKVFPMTQLIHRSDGTTTARDAGTFEYHPTHAHHHHAETMVYDLLAVDGDELIPFSGGVKTGFCPLDLGLADWRDFTHAPHGQVQSEQSGDCVLAYTLSDPEGAMGISAGWADLYDRAFSGQFVDFSDGADGLWVVRVTVDGEDLILESDETDNVAYALVRVTGEDVDIIERGYGTDHLDPHRVVATDNRDSRAPVSLHDRITHTLLRS